MLLLTAFQVRDQVEEFIVVETHDLTRDSRDACSHGFHMKTPELRS